MVGSTGMLKAKDIIGIISRQYNPILEYRILRTIAALTLGIGLGAAGLTLQYSLKNPMADPYLLGVSTGAAFGVILLFSVTPTPQTILIYFSGLLWGLIAFLIVIGVGAYTGAGPTSLIVAGVSVNYAFFGLIVLFMSRSPEAQRFNFTWLFGTVAYATKNVLLISTGITIAAILAMVVLSDKLYTLILGDEVAESMGINVPKLRLLSVTISSIATASLVALAGPVGFIGLAAPWATRLIVGSHYRTALVGSIMMGGIASIGSDLMIRLISGGGEIPLTAVTALFGAPILFYLSRKTGW
jgi:iron complex transport system permease protein